MNDNTPQPPQNARKPGQPPRRRRGPAKAQAQRASAPAHPVLVQLAAAYPVLFGDQPRPLKRGIYADLLTAQSEAVDAEGLKAALAQHTRSTRYLSSVAAGMARHDLQGQVVEAMAPEHVLHALLEVHKRRQGRSQEDLRPKLRQRIAQAFEASGLSREDYAVLLPSRDPAIRELVDQALDEAAARAAKDAALHRAYSASGLEPGAFAASYGLPVAEVQRMLERVKRRGGN
jgi:sRNA-binding protein